jgi:acyl carrier protein
MVNNYKMEIPEKLLAFINEARQPLPPVNDADEPLHLDSLAMMKLVSFLESEIGYTVEDEELALQNFESLRSISNLLQGKGAKL